MFKIILVIYSRGKVRLINYYYFRKEFLHILKNVIDSDETPSYTTSEGKFRVEKLTKQNIECCIDYDSNIALAVNRQEYLKYLFELYGVNLFKFFNF